MAEIGVEVKGLEELLAKLSGKVRERVAEAVFNSFNVDGARLEGMVKRNVRSMFKTRTGALLNATAYRVSGGAAMSGREAGTATLTGKGGGSGGQSLAVLQIGNLRAAEGQRGLVYYRQRHDGGVIRGRPWLVWPIDVPGNPMLTKKARVGGVNASSARANPKSLGITHTFRGKGKNSDIIFGVRSRGKGKGEVIPLFVMRTSVKQVGRPFLLPTVRAEAPNVQKRAIRAVVEAIKKGGR